MDLEAAVLKVGKYPDKEGWVFKTSGVWLKGVWESEFMRL